MTKGAFTFVLHTHLPYCRGAGRWPHGEEWLHEAASETYLPLLQALYRLRDEGCRFRLTLGLTPVLIEQLADPLVREHLRAFLEDKVARARADQRRFEKAGEHQRKQVAAFYQQFYEGVLESFLEKFGGDLIASFRLLQEEGYIEILTSAATHGYLPLLERDSSIYGQLRAGVECYRRHFGQAPRAVWLPECGYRPGFYTQVEGGSHYVKPGLEGFLAELGLGCFFTETHTVEGGEPVGKARGEALGPYGSIPKRYVIPVPDYEPPRQCTTYQPYWVGGTEVGVLGRNNRTGMQVWSADHGYPGDFHYREFHKRDGISGLNYWRVSGAQVDLGQKDLYDPESAAWRVGEHVEHYCRLVEELLEEYNARNNRFGIIVAAYDTELFGHWWFEGISWLEGVLLRLSRSPMVGLTTASDFVAQHPPEEVLALPEGSWGQAGNHFTWLNGDTEWVWPLIHAAEREMEGLVESFPEAEGARESLLNQAARELLLLESSDWPFLVTTGQAREYATLRFQEHLTRFQRLAALARAPHLPEASLELVQEFYEVDKVFPDIDYRWFQNREGMKVERASTPPLRRR